MTTMTNGHGIGKRFPIKRMLAVVVGICLALRTNADEQVNPDLNDIKPHMKVAINRLANDFVDALNSRKEEEFAKLFCSTSAYINYRVPKDDVKKLSERSLSVSYAIAKVNFMSDFEAFQKAGNGFSHPLNLRYKSSRVIGAVRDDYMQGLEILVEYGDNFGTGMAYIITGEVVKDGDRWSFLGRCREIYSRFPAK